MGGEGRGRQGGAGAAGWGRGTAPDRLIKFSELAGNNI